ncbi:MAG: hypothetical protein OXC40_06045 [Proteobacteria bacterium]|nr:hypothetical protein [Pseudomonadota bacterium]
MESSKILGFKLSLSALKSFSLSLVRRSLYVLPSIVLLLYITWPSIISLVATIHFQYSEKDDISQLVDPVKIQQRIQGFYLKYRMTISQGDIVFRTDHHPAAAKIGCLKHSVVIFVPFTLRLPYFGKSVYERCFVVKY